MRRNIAFTLIELLVVISIIALLITILLPVLSKVQYQSRISICTSNLKQIGIGATAHAVDNKSRYPHNMLPTTDRYLNALDNQYYRWEHKPWSIFSKGKFDLIPVVEPYFSDLNEIFLCPLLESDWNKDIYAPSTNDKNIPYNLYWGISNTGNPAASRIPMNELDKGMGPGTALATGGITKDSRYHVLASDYIRRISATKFEANHPPAGGDYIFTNRANADGTGYSYNQDTIGNANYLYDDGSVVMYGQIYQGTIGSTSNFLFRNAGRWIIPTDRVER